jgi:hypothetical protein
MTTPVRRTWWALCLLSWWCGARQTRAAVFHVWCHDGGAGVTVQRGSRRLRTTGDSSVCDVDQACDGVCTFVIDQAYLPCYLGLCSSDDVAGVGNNAMPPCPSSYTLHQPYAVDIMGRRSRTRVVRYPRNRRVPARVAVLHCLRGRRADCAATTTTTLPPGLPDLTGDWTRTVTGSGSNCPPEVDAFLTSLVTSVPNVGALQMGTGINTCAAGAVSAGIDPISGGTVSSEGFVLKDSGSIGPPPLCRTTISPGNSPGSFMRIMSTSSTNGI